MSLFAHKQLFLRAITQTLGGAPSVGGAVAPSVDGAEAEHAAADDDGFIHVSHEGPCLDYYWIENGRLKF